MVRHGAYSRAGDDGGAGPQLRDGSRPALAGAARGLPGGGAARHGRGGRGDRLRDDHEEERHRDQRPRQPPLAGGDRRGRAAVRRRGQPGHAGDVRTLRPQRALRRVRGDGPGRGRPYRAARRTAPARPPRPSGRGGPRLERGSGRDARTGPAGGGAGCPARGAGEASAAGPARRRARPALPAGAHALRWRTAAGTGGGPAVHGAVGGGVRPRRAVRGAAPGRQGAAGRAHRGPARLREHRPHDRARSRADRPGGLGDRRRPEGRTRAGGWWPRALRRRWRPLPNR